MAAVRSIFDLAPRRVAVMQSEKTKVSYGPAPMRQPRGAHQLFVTTFERGGWVVVPHAEAKALVEAAQSLGGQATRYMVSDLQSCVKVLEAPWKAPRTPQD